MSCNWSKRLEPLNYEKLDSNTENIFIKFYPDKQPKLVMILEQLEQQRKIFS